MSRESEIRKFIFDTFMTGADDKDLDNDDSLIDKGIIDSMGMLELIAFALSNTETLYHPLSL